VAASVLMEEMSWAELRVALERGARTAVMACGAIEQHGPHLPTGTDTYLGTAIAVRAARQAGDTLVAPTLRPALSEHHMGFPGSFTVRPETFVALLRDCCESLARQGFERIVVFASHGGNVDTMRAHVPPIARELQDRVRLTLSSVIAGPAGDAVRSHLEERGIGRGRAGAHAGYSETSMMLAERPDLVDMTRAEPGRCDDDFYLPENLSASQMESFLHGVQSQAPNGILGDPTGAKAEDGATLLALAADILARDIELAAGTPSAAAAP
jgi:creatinine amidohydrolase